LDASEEYSARRRTESSTPASPAARNAAARSPDGADWVVLIPDAIQLSPRAATAVHGSPALTMIVDLYYPQSGGIDPRSSVTELT
jgi:hypothetical protein